MSVALAFAMWLLLVVMVVGLAVIVAMTVAECFEADQ